MVVPFGSARERRSRTTYRPTATPEGSTHVDTAFTGTTSSFSRTASGKVAVVAVVRQQVFAEAPGPTAKAVTLNPPTQLQLKRSVTDLKHGLARTSDAQAFRPVADW
ncbi:hypothetical protein GCM10017674_53120 [Streptomyces gardneri]|uniref:Uncharacterized protein n=1 Tax=Streptomyces gardneri TaxID=66892 RepID=A0A4Y3RD64_9ACTN|nr:hypothetical protein SGA01_09140 [Streptomyces gardneri]GHH09583.1 hypothetical protein GCM10017674_53120 [Streptomyces gardneri]